MGKSSTNQQVLLHCLAAGNYLKIFKGPSSFKSQQTSFSGLSKNMWLFYPGGARCKTESGKPNSLQRIGLLLLYQ
jgi:hypothetical protein